MSNTAFQGCPQCTVGIPPAPRLRTPGVPPLQNRLPCSPDTCLGSPHPPQTLRWKICHEQLTCQCFLGPGPVLRTLHALTQPERKPPWGQHHPWTPLQRSQPWPTESNFLVLMRGARFEPRQNASKLWPVFMPMTLDKYLQCYTTHAASLLCL